MNKIKLSDDIKWENSILCDKTIDTINNSTFGSRGFVYVTTTHTVPHGISIGPILLIYWGKQGKFGLSSYKNSTTFFYWFNFMYMQKNGSHVFIHPTSIWANNGREIQMATSDLCRNMSATRWWAVQALDWRRWCWC